ncbi:formimidoylglutamase [Clostridium estertheticum]|uniref:formimidoylglutamase n=1 Tax=Clostridium estertheticum TaxID=238834 RepID=UPI001C7CE930|nr:formimidoylglutamase [Clostridium estertheticum]MBX4263050.1 formimidoylglutamase [Clostridium estertheticum]WLC89371.1 formimidoylglutamase [Clostridium estertheticum]
MFDKNYKITNEGVWQGRTDSESNYDAFRWHQCVKIIDLRRDDLILYTGKLGFAFIGFCCDEGVRRNGGRTGAANGPKSIRKELSNLPCDFSKEVKLFDVGDICCEDCTLEESQDLLSKAIEKVLSLNLFPIVLGGGHEVAFGNYMGTLDYLSQRSKQPNIGIINFDAHFDLRPCTQVTSSGTMFRQIADICIERELEYSYLCIGVQKHSNTIDLFKTADTLGVKYMLAKDIIDNDNWKLMEDIDDFIKLKDYLYVTICSDVFSTAFAPGVSSSQPLGLDPERVLKFLKYILRSNKVVSFDIAEVSPRFDQDDVTANLAAVLIFSVVNTICGINRLTDSSY